MSKEALTLLAKRLNESSSEETASKYYRNKVIVPQLHSIDLTATSISEHIETEIQLSEPDVYNSGLLTKQDYRNASAKMRAFIHGKATGTGTRKAVTYLETSPGVLNKNVVVGGYSALSTVLEGASKLAVEHLNSVIAQKNGSPMITRKNSKGNSLGKLVSLDHTRTVGETRIARDIYQQQIAGDKFGLFKLDPTVLVQELKNRNYINDAFKDNSETLSVYDNILEIISYYKGNERIFELRGRVEDTRGRENKNAGAGAGMSAPIQGKIASSTLNQKEGAKIVARRAAVFQEALQAAIRDVSWDSQKASDSYREFVAKSLNNAAVKAGSSGKIQKLNTGTSKVKSTKTVKEKIKTASNKPVIPLEFKLKRGSIKRVTQPKYSLQAITNYINSKLPETVRANMGPGNLNNRTGTFASSVKAVSTTLTEQGYPSIGYTYQRSPYDVFDPTLGKLPWNIPSRDPNKLISKSIREIAQEMAIGRFYTRRV